MSAKSKGLSESVEQVLAVMNERNRKGKSIGQQDVAQYLYDQNGVSISNSTYAKARAIYDRIQVHPLLQDEDLLIQVGLTAATKLIASLPSMQSFDDVMALALREKERADKLENQLEEIRMRADSLKKVSDLLNSKGVTNLASKVNQVLEILGEQ